MTETANPSVLQSPDAGDLGGISYRNLQFGQQGKV